MKKFFVLLFLFVILHSFFTTRILAFDASRQNNKFGIHLATPSKEELEGAAKLVNTRGGNWGYVTVVIQENDRNTIKWQEAFDHMRELRLIPIVRLATSPAGSSWVKPTASEIQNWLSFLNSLKWVVKDRYIVLFNEPNHSAEWGGELNPEEFASVTYEYAKAIKSANSDYFVMVGGLDLAAASNGPDMEAFTYLQRMVQSKKELWDHVDGLSSHSYPNPGFAGSPYDSGRTSIRGYEWELSTLKQLGIAKDLPVFITETGWRHGGVDSEDIASYYRTAFEYWQLDSRVRAVTPFILSYQGEPFLQFSWQKQNSPEFYRHYYEVESMPKAPGNPIQDQKGMIIQDLPSDLLAQSTYHFKVKLKNEGRAIWTSNDGYRLAVLNAPELQNFEYFFGNIANIKPGEEGEVDLYVKTNDQLPNQIVRVGLFKNDQPVIALYPWTFRILPLPRLIVKASLFPRIRPKAERDFEVQIFNSNEELVFKQKRLKRQKGEITVPEVRNVYLKGTFRVVVLSQYYLPRQTFVRFEDGENKASIMPLLPFDWHPDGTFNFNDIGAVFKNPRLLGLFLP